MIALEFHKTVIVPGLTFMTVMLGPAHGDTKWEDDARARVLLNAMAGQETGWQNIPQLGDGPGRGPWQLGEDTCDDLFRNPTSSLLMRKICQALNIPPVDAYSHLLAQPRLSVALSRLDLLCNLHALPNVGAQAAAWAYYVDTWRPGDPRPTHWPACYQAAVSADNQLFGETPHVITS